MDVTRSGVSAEAFVDVVRAYADRVHDDVRRIGCTPAEAAEVVETSALSLLEALRLSPDTVPDLVGAWFRDARVLADRVHRADADVDGEIAADGDTPVGLIRRSEDDRVARRALSALTRRDRIALLLRDAYDLPYPATAVALGLTPQAAAAVVAGARLRFLALANREGALEAAGHEAQLAELAQHVDNTLDHSRLRAVRSHSASCPICRTAEPQLREARGMMTGLAILAMPDSRRDGMLALVATAAERMLPSAEQLAEANTRGRGMPRWGIIAACVAGALVLGTLVGVATSRVDSSGSGRAPDVPLPSDSPTPTVTATASVSATASAAASTTAAATADATPTDANPTATSSPIGTAILTLSRTSGPNCQLVQIRGRNWIPGQIVQISYTNSFGNQTASRRSATPDSVGTFSVSLRLCDTLPGPHQVRATNNRQTTSVSYTQTS